MDTRDAGKLGGQARAQNQTLEQLTAIGQAGALARWGADVARRKRTQARKLARIAAASRKANR